MQALPGGGARRGTGSQRGRGNQGTFTFTGSSIVLPVQAALLQFRLELRSVHFAPTGLPVTIQDDAQDTLLRRQLRLAQPSPGERLTRP